MVAASMIGAGHTEISRFLPPRSSTEKKGRPSSNRRAVVLLYQFKRGERNAAKCPSTHAKRAPIKCFFIPVGVFPASRHFLTYTGPMLVVQYVWVAIAEKG
jgi:hypothetical protein